MAGLGFVKPPPKSKMGWLKPILRALGVPKTTLKSLVSGSVILFGLRSCCTTPVGHGGCSATSDRRFSVAEPTLRLNRGGFFDIWGWSNHPEGPWGLVLPP